jgi:hypothetical protein
MSGQSDVLAPDDHEHLSHIIAIRDSLEHCRSILNDLWRELPDSVIADDTVQQDLDAVKQRLYICEHVTSALLKSTIAALHDRRRHLWLQCLRETVTQ